MRHPNPLDDELRYLERQARAGDQNAITRLVAIAQRNAQVTALDITPHDVPVNARTMRNWWIEFHADNDGRAHGRQVGFGPSTARDAGFWMRILQRNQGGADEVLTLAGFSDGNELRLDLNGTPIYRTQR